MLEIVLVLAFAGIFVFGLWCIIRIYGRKRREIDYWQRQVDAERSYTRHGTGLSTPSSKIRDGDRRKREADDDCFIDLSIPADSGRYDSHSVRSHSGYSDTPPSSTDFGGFGGGSSGGGGRTGGWSNDSDSSGSDSGGDGGD